MSDPDPTPHEAPPGEDDGPYPAGAGTDPVPLDENVEQGTPGCLNCPRVRFTVQVFDALMEAYPDTGFSRVFTCKRCGFTWKRRRSAADDPPTDQEASPDPGPAPAPSPKQTNLDRLLQKIRPQDQGGENRDA